MKYIKYTKVDYISRVSSLERSMVNGPDNPSVKGLVEGFTQQSENGPFIYFGTCDDDADLGVSGVLGEITEKEYNEAYNKEQASRFEKTKQSVILDINQLYSSEIRKAREQCLAALGLTEVECTLISNNLTLESISHILLEKEDASSWLEFYKSIVHKRDVRCLKLLGLKRRTLNKVSAVKTEKSLFKAVELWRKAVSHLEVDDE